MRSTNTISQIIRTYRKYIVHINKSIFYYILEIIVRRSTFKKSEYQDLQSLRSNGIKRLTSQIRERGAEEVTWTYNLHLRQSN